MNPGKQTIRRTASMRRTFRARTEHGFSLLEVLVTLIVLLIGILAVLRLFPGGFLTIQRTGEQTLGTQAAEQQLDLMRSLLVQPDYIVPGLPDDHGLIHEILGIRPDDLAQETDASLALIAQNNGFTLAPGYAKELFWDIDRIRYVKGATSHVPISNANIADASQPPIPYGSLAVLDFGPVYNHFDTAATPVTDSIHVYGAPLTRTMQSALATSDTPDPRPLLRNESEYAIDYVNSQIAFFPRVAKDPGAGGTVTTFRDFQITFDYYDPSSNPPILKTQTGKIHVLDLNPNTIGQGVAPQPVWQSIYDATNNPAPAKAVIRAESEDVSRLFKLITTDNKGAFTLTFQPDDLLNPNTFGPQWSEDPYEYAWYSRQQGGDSNNGILVFNPRGHLSFLTNSNVTDIDALAQAQPFTNTQSLVARVDYLIYDNHIIRDQRTVPSSGPYVVKLSFPNVLTNGDLLEDGSTYTGIIRGSATPDVVIINANDGSEVSEISQGTVPANTTDVPFTLDATSGTITFVARTPDKKGIEDLNLQGNAIRILYRTQKNWGQQVQKASSMYTSAPSPDGITYKTYFIGDGTNGTLPTHIYFSPSEAGKTVVLGEYYLQAASGIINTPYKNDTFRISDNPADFTPINGTLYPSIDVTDTDHHPTADNEHIPQGGSASDAITGITDQVSGRAVNNLRGLSIKSRVIWKSSGRIRQIDQDSVLPTDRL
jgi:prepilin-type N-terminal cleavage/methylation domain-containing protein